MVRSPVEPGPGTIAKAATAAGWYDWGKPLFDRIVSIVALVVLSPVLLIIALAISLDSPGPIIFRQTRVGKDGREFTMYKFRTMADGAEDTPHRAAFERFFRARSLEETGASTFKIEHDPRVTRVGRFLRRTSLDELPQLFNVFQGTMSLVGPRPPIPYETELYQTRHWQRLAVRPGITGTWQSMARSQVPFEEMVDLDLDYISRRSFLLDLKILLLTIRVVLSQEGAG